MFHIIIVCRGGSIGGNSGSDRSDCHNEEVKGTDKARHDCDRVIVRKVLLKSVVDLPLMLSLQLLPLEQGGSYYLALIKAC